MAGHALEEGLQKHQKVYSFLKRWLPHDRYEGVRVIEPCVIVSDDFNKAFTFAVLGDELLYITENPPKTSKDIKLAVDLADIVSVELIHDFADFLGGDLRSKNQHILIVYKKNGNEKTLNNSVSPAIEMGSSSKLALSASVLITSPVLHIEGTERNTQASPILKLRSPKPSRTEKQHLSPRNGASKFQSLSNPNVQAMLHNSDDNHIHSLSATNIRVNNPKNSPQSSRPLPPPPPGHEGDVVQMHAKFRTRLDSQDKPLTPTSSRRLRRKSEREDELNSSSSSSELDLPPYRPFSRSLHDFSQPSENSLNLKHHQPARPRSPRLFHSGSEDCARSPHGSFDSDDEQEMTNDGFDTSQMHLYILTENSPMFVYLKSTWNNSILKSTLKCASRERALATSSPTSSQSKVDSSQLMQLFHQLKSEILQSHLMEKTFVLVQELLTAAQKSFQLKKYFWKSPELFPFLVTQILLYLPQSQSKSSGNNRADELDFVVVLLQTLVCMFRETEILPSRLGVVKANKGQTLRELVRTLTKQPSAGRAVKTDISPAAQQLLCGPHGGKATKGRDEMAKLLREITNNASALLYEIILLAHQAKCFAGEDNVLNICWLMKTLESQDSTIPFVQRLMEQTQRPFSSKDCFLSPREAVLLYKELSILRNFLEYSESISSHIRAVYAEEFRYYIRRDVVRKKLPVNYPLSSPIVKVLGEVTKLVLDQKPKSHGR